MVVSDPDGKFNAERGIIYPHDEIGGTILKIINAHTKDCAALVKWDTDVDEHFASHGSWIYIDCLTAEYENISTEINDLLSDFLVNA